MGWRKLGVIGNHHLILRTVKSERVGKHSTGPGRQRITDQAAGQICADPRDGLTASAFVERPPPGKVGEAVGGMTGWIQRVRSALKFVPVHVAIVIGITGGHTRIKQRQSRLHFPPIRDPIPNGAVVVGQQHTGMLIDLQITQAVRPWQQARQIGIGAVPWIQPVRCFPGIRHPIVVAVSQIRVRV